MQVYNSDQNEPTTLQKMIKYHKLWVLSVEIPLSYFTFSKISIRSPYKFKSLFIGLLGLYLIGTRKGVSLLSEDILYFKDICVSNMLSLYKSTAYGKILETNWHEEKDKFCSR